MIAGLLAAIVILLALDRIDKAGMPRATAMPGGTWLNAGGALFALLAMLVSAVVLLRAIAS